MPLSEYSDVLVRAIDNEIARLNNAKSELLGTTSDVKRKGGRGGRRGPMSEATKEKMRAAQKARYARQAAIEGSAPPQEAAPAQEAPSASDGKRKGGRPKRKS